ncbi:protein disulfide-isomerase A4-like [Malaya genurostris]|uniref:protein disulfide-isomerase A4-like n=1 Tax=Malaya genurostris TaxID=325434 RepID=UPI0026F3FC79|nr:protein disulfide-isomerase A4-like [Malaya genurostris]
MKSILVVAFVIFQTVYCANLFPSENGVLVLDPTSFDAALRQYPVLLVEFFAPWCRYCQALAPKYASAAGQLASMNATVKLAKLDAHQYSEFASRYGVQRYPTLKLFNHGTVSEYGGEHEQSPIVQWLMQFERKIGASPVVKSSPTDVFPHLSRSKFNATIAVNPLIVVEFYSPACSHCRTFAPVFLEIAKELATINPNIKFAKVDGTREAALLTEQNVSSYPTIKLFLNGHPLTYEGSRDKESIINWLLTASRTASSFVKREVSFQPDVRGELFRSEGNDSQQVLPTVLNLILLMAVAFLLTWT